MTVAQIVLYVILGAILVLYLRKVLLSRSIPHYEPAEASERSSGGGSAVLLDVRTESERRAQHIKGSIHVPLHQLTRRIDELKKYKNQEVICYCRSGNRSLTAAAKLRRHGFMSANMRGGLQEWNFRKMEPIAGSGKRR